MYRVSTRCSGMWIALICILVFMDSISTDPVEVKDLPSAMAYVRKYLIGQDYKNDKFGDLTSESEMSSAISEFQESAGLPVTGELDDATKELMNSPRCGMKDKTSRADDVKRRKRFVVQGSRWRNTSPLSYRFKTYSEDMSNTLQEEIMATAFKYWSDVTNLDFYLTRGSRADFDILWAEGNHENEDSTGDFDGPGGTLAHAYFPAFGGDLHYDEAERWTHETNSGINLLQVAVHEVGHSLGLSHSNVQDAIMYAFYRGYRPNFTLHRDDIEGIQSIYGIRNINPPPATQPATTRPTPTQPTTTQPTQRTTQSTIRTTRSTERTTQSTVRPIPTQAPTDDRIRFCNNVRFDAISTIGDRTFAFKDDLYVELQSGSVGIAPGFPRKISDDWPGAPSNIDAIVYWGRNNPPRSYIFKGTEYWRYELTNGRNFQLKAGYPRKISNGFQGVPDNIDAAFVWRRNGQTYIFKDNIYYRLFKDPNTERSRGRVDSGYPRSINLWRLPDVRPDAAFTFTNNRTYFFSGNQYYRYDDFRIQVDPNANPSYPRDIDQWWTSCSRSGNLKLEMDDQDVNEFLIATQVDDHDGPTPPAGEEPQAGGANTVRQTALAVLSLIALMFCVL